MNLTLSREGQSRSPTNFVDAHAILRDAEMSGTVPERRIQPISEFL
jgi:hypothetical protein